MKSIEQRDADWQAYVSQCEKERAAWVSITEALPLEFPSLDRGISDAEVGRQVALNPDITTFWRSFNGFDFTQALPSGEKRHVDVRARGIRGFEGLPRDYFIAINAWQFSPDVSESLSGYIYQDDLKNAEATSGLVVRVLDGMRAEARPISGSPMDIDGKEVFGVVRRVVPLIEAAMCVWPNQYPKKFPNLDIKYANVYQHAMLGSDETTTITHFESQGLINYALSRPIVEVGQLIP